MVKWKREGRVFSVDLNGASYYARYQFDTDYEPLPIIAEIISAFEGTADQWKIAAWIHFRNGYILNETPDGRLAAAPKDALNRPDVIQHALLSRTGTYVA